ncbi:siroheme decarboxylase [Candidatus Magnetomoraceae bacterium gMMP-15]
MLTELEKKIIASIQGDIPVTEHPFLEIAKKIGISEEILTKKIKDLCERGIIRRFGVTIRHQISGFQANAMVAWKADENSMEKAGKKMASFREVSHCYRRNPTKNWPYNLYTMIHGGSEDECRDIAKHLSEESSIENYAILFSQRELKKTSMQYFTEFDD